MTALKSSALTRSLHASSAHRTDFFQDLYSQEIRAFQPQAFTDKDAEGSVLKWSLPTAPKAPGEEVKVSDLDSYSGAAVEVESASSSEAVEESNTSEDWFPIESFDANEEAH